nr:retrovirus-related Pol polyprotein from transposon TNT 1-94 [Tanacetum cinerariifolium]
RPFKCPVTILNTKDYLGKFDGKADEGFFIGYSLNSKAFIVFNSRTRIVEENLHIRFSKNTHNVVGTQSNDYEGTKASDNAGQARKETKHDDGFKPSTDDVKKVNKDLRKEYECNDQDKEDNVNSTNNVNTVSLIVNVTGTNEDNKLPFDPNMLALEDVSIFNFSNDDEDDDIVADINNMDTTIQVSPIPTTRIHKDHPLNQVIRDLRSATQTRQMLKNLEEHGKKKNKRGIVIRNKAILVAQGRIQEEGIDYDEVFTPVVRIETIRLFLAYALFKDFVVYQMDVKSAFLYRKIKEQVYICQPPGFEDPDFPDRVYKVKKALYGLHQASRAWFSEVKNASTPMETQKPLLKDEDGEEVDVHMYRYQVNLKVSHLHDVKRIF